MKSSTSNLFISNCDEFIYYDDLVREAHKTPPACQESQGREEAGSDRPAHEDPAIAGARLRSFMGFRRQAGPSPCLSQLQRRPTYGYRTFSDLLEDAQSLGLVELEHDKARGNYKVRLKRASQSTGGI